jgi:hypothetical protein
MPIVVGAEDAGKAVDAFLHEGLAEFQPEAIGFKCL